ncbi:MAG: magnesium transporter [Archaeoglobaceae archaeon]
MKDVELTALRLNFRDFTESTVALMLCTLGALVTGVVMGHGSDRFVVLPALVLLIPPSIALRGNIYASLGSRLGSYLHTGKISPTFVMDQRVARNVYSSTLLLLIFSIIAGLLAAQMAIPMGLNTIESSNTGFLELTLSLALISTLAAFFSAILMIPCTFALAIGSYRWGWNPDNVTAPFITLVGDMVTLPLLFASMDIVLAIDSYIKVTATFIVLLLTAGFYLLNKRTEQGGLGEKIVRESIPVLLICTVLNFGAGTILGDNLESFVALAGLFIIIPAFLEDGGAIGGILSARISTMLHLGILYPESRPPKEVLLSFGTMHLLALIIFPVIGLAGQMVNQLLQLPTIPTVQMVLLTVIAGQLLMLTLDLLTYYFSIIAYRKNLDPDNVGVPLITSSADILGMACLVFTMMLLNIV